MTSTKSNKLQSVLFVLLLISVGNYTTYSNENYPVGARSLALSHASVSFSDVWSAFHNQAGLAGLKSISTGFFYESRFGIDELSLVSGSVVCR